MRPSRRSWRHPLPTASYPAGAPAPKAELLSITSGWAPAAADILARVAVPLHYRQAAHDSLWIVGSDEVAGFAAALTNSPMVDARLVENVGHCIDFHRLGPALHLQQLGFALECANC